MSLNVPDPHRDLILAHVPYVRGLARQLVFDAELAKDVEQDVLLAALENAPRDPGSLKAWLAAVLRHLASKAFRARERRAARESARAVQSVPTPAEILAREDLRRALVERVLALDAPVRDVLILRYFEDLPPREVARKLGIPVETVRTRAKRGVEQIRAHLEREPGQRGGAWCLALVAGLKLEPPSLALAGASVAAASLSGVVAMSVSKKVAVAAIVLACAGWISFKSGIPATPKGTQVLATPESSALVSPPREATATVDPAEGRTAVAAPALAARTRTSAEETGSVLLRVLWHDGTPAAGVNARVRQTANDFNADAFEVVTGNDGTRRVEGLLPGQASFYLDRGPAEGRTIEAGKHVDLELTIPRGFDIIGRVVERGGRTLAGADIFLNVVDSDWDGHIVARSDAAGRFEVRSVEEETQVYLSARAPMRSPSVQLELVGATAAVQEVELVLDPLGAAIEGVALGADGQPLQGASILIGPAEVEQHLFLEGGVRARAPAGQLVVSGELGRFAVTGIPVGRLEVQARSPGHAPWKGEVETVERRTASLQIRFEPGSTLTGRITDSENRPVAGAAVHGNGSYDFASRYVRTSADGTFALRDLPGAEFPVSVRAKGFEGAETLLTGAPGAELTWNPVLGSGLAIRGRLGLSGTDFSRWSVTCESQDKERSPMHANVHPDVDGAFEIRGCADVPHRIEVHAPESRGVFPAAVRKDVRPGGPPLAIALESDCIPTCTLRGRIADESGQPLAGLHYTLRRESDNLAPSLPTSVDGSFEVGPYPSGRYRVEVHSAEFAKYLGDYVQVAAGGSADFGEIRLQRGGTIAVRLARDPALAEAKVSVSALPPGSDASRWMPLMDDEARSEALPPGEYLVRVRGFDAADSVAQCTARVIVLAGEESRVDLRVEAGVRLDFAWTPDDLLGADVQLFGASGAIVCEERLGRHDSLMVPAHSVRLLARDGAGRSADVPLALAGGAAVLELAVELK